MQYIIMCGGQYDEWKTPRQLVKINGETIVNRTIRLLRENGIKNIAISTHDPRFKECGVSILWHNNNWRVIESNKQHRGYWVECFYPTDYEVCYLMGDVIFSPDAIRKIVCTETDDVEFFASAPPFAWNYPKGYAEPFAFKVKNTKHFLDAIELTKAYEDEGYFARHPIAWEFWQVVKNTPLNEINFKNYVAINDYTCDIDSEEDIKLFKGVL